jgi:hypothetical protein
MSPQSGTIDGPAIAGTSTGDTDAPTNPDAITPISSGGSNADQTLNVFFGEAPKSIRELTRRYIKHRTDVFAAPTDSTSYALDLRDKGLGYFRGDDPNGIDGSSSFVNTTFAQWFMPCYAGWRGSTRTKYVFNSKSPDSNPSVSRIGYSTANRITKTIFSDAEVEEELSRKLTYYAGQFSAGGAATTNIGVNNTIEVETPYYNGVRFSTARIPTGNFVNGCHSNLVSALVSSTADATGPVVRNYFGVSSWKSVGEDFTLFFFTGCPILYKYANTPF